ncbi:hypothetical protein T440DRAFT_555841 [Plenodomus tracheiphilus IPT5]|uniref:Uncharacterized protein n=1 Tax=Plenodomus tracheiphilus IPT5 TaxID=1408161 RepID=A0A6A7B5E7_9PLEO|nr:hypothetical protein T440DRAFT_555841 [Plenodomus tracheiphilus IPT5]
MSGVTSHVEARAGFIGRDQKAFTGNIGQLSNKAHHQTFNLHYVYNYAKDVRRYPRRHWVAIIASFATMITLIVVVIVVAIEKSRKDDSDSSGQSSSATSTSSSLSSVSVSWTTTAPSNPYASTTTGLTSGPASTSTLAIPSPTTLSTPTLRGGEEALLSTSVATNRFVTSIPHTLVTEPARLSPGASCTTNAQCSPNDCYTQSDASATCCGPSIWGCPGWDCNVNGINDCLDPYTCENSGVKTCA